MKKTLKVRKERHFRPHTDFYHAVSVHLQHVQKKHDGYFYSLLSAIMMSAFTVEAYLNYVGPKVEPGWDDFDKASPIAKLRHVASLLHLELDPSSGPMQTVTELFRFRNNMAHPRPSQLVEETLHTHEDYQKSLYEQPIPKWMNFATEKNAQRCYDDIGKLVATINSKLPEPEILPLHDMSWSGSASSAE